MGVEWHHHLAPVERLLGIHPIELFTGALLMHLTRAAMGNIDESGCRYDFDVFASRELVFEPGWNVAKEWHGPPRSAKI